MKTIRFFGMVLMTILLSISFAACSSDDDDTKLPDATVAPIIDINDFLSISDENLEVKSLTLNRSESSKGIEIKSVTYYIDNELVATVSTSPFAFTYPIAGLSRGKHELYFEVNIDGGGDYNDGCARFHNYFYVYSISVHRFSDIIWGNTHSVENGKSVVTKGDIVNGTIQLNPDIDDADGVKITKVEYYWDDNLFGAANKSPWGFSYDTSNENKGEHEMKWSVNYSTNYGDFNIITTHTIIIK